MCSRATRSLALLCLDNIFGCFWLAAARFTWCMHVSEVNTEHMRRFAPQYILATTGGSSSSKNQMYGFIGKVLLSSSLSPSSSSSFLARCARFFFLFLSFPFQVRRQQISKICHCLNLKSKSHVCQTRQSLWSIGLPPNQGDDTTSE